MADRTGRQLDLLARMAALDPIPCVIGGYAEDALVAGTVTREHEDIDWLVPRSELSHRLDQAERLGFTEFETWGESAPGEPFYLYTKHGDLSIDIGVCDEVDGRHVVDVFRLAFLIDGKEAPAGYRVFMPADTFEHERASIDGIEVWPASPLALYQMRIGIASQGSFGELNEKQRASLRRLKESFFPDRSDEELTPPIEPLETG
jgi:hypothetical protein